MRSKIVSIGEILWDSMPLGLFLGGAPFNAAYHLSRLGDEVSFISRVGKDQLGEEAVRRVKIAGLSSEHLQVDDHLKTGFVEVSLGGHGIPEYHIKKPVAWDQIMLTKNVKKAIETADAVVFGTLAQRSEISKKTIQSVETGTGLKVLDLNFRYPFVDKEIVEHSMSIADIIKMNDDELYDLQSWHGLPSDTEESLERIAVKYSLQTICLTRGSEGAMLWNDGAIFEAKGYEVEVVDTVGSGDAFLAAFISGYLRDISFDKLLEYANRLGAYVATRSGGTPGYSVTSYSDIQDLPLKNRV